MVPPACVQLRPGRRSRPTAQTPSVTLQLGFFTDFVYEAGLLRETGAGREGSGLFVIDEDPGPASGSRGYVSWNTAAAILTTR